jgi:TolA-binding protein
MNDLDRQIVMLYSNLMMPVGPNRSHPPVETRSAAFTAEEARSIEESMKSKIEEYNQLRQQLQQLNSRL